MLMGEEADGVLVGVVGSLVVEVHALLLHVCKSAVAGQPRHKTWGLQHARQLMVGTENAAILSSNCACPDVSGEVAEAFNMQHAQAAMVRALLQSHFHGHRPLRNRACEL